MSETAAQLSGSEFIADLTPRERSVWRFVVTLLGGLTAGVILGLLVGMLALLAFAAASGAFASGLVGLGPRIAGLVNDESVRGALALLTLATATNGPLALAFIALAALLTGRRMKTFVTTAPHIRWRLLASGLVLALLMVGPVVLLGQALDPKAAPPPMLSLTPSLLGRIGYVLACFALLIPAAAAEEVLFRGWLLRQCAAVTRNPVALMAVNGVLFSAVHGEFAPDAFLTRALMGAGFVYMTLRLGGIEFSTGAHAANNILIVLLIQPLTLKPSPSAGLGLDAVIQDAGLFIGYVLMAEAVARWTPLRRLSGVDPPAPRPPANAVAAPAP